jgi:hypothetical protein
MTWGTINLAAGGDKLPPPGQYAGTITDVRLFEKPDVLWCSIDFSLEETNTAPRPALHAIAATDDSPHRRRVADGLRFLYRLFQAAGVEVAGVDYEELPRLLIGKRLELTVAHSVRDGVPELVVRSTRPLTA